MVLIVWFYELIICGLEFAVNCIIYAGFLNIFLQLEAGAENLYFDLYCVRFRLVEGLVPL
jgi:hypothetical protein